MKVLYKNYKKLNLIEIADNIRQFWIEKNIFQKSIENRINQKEFIFFEGPPSANGKPGVHHVMTRTIKDIFCRFQTLKGKKVNRKSGWDTHGLPVELSLEKKLNITKEDIGKKISITEYNQMCKQSVLKYTDIWKKLTKQIGFWIDLDNPYLTCDTKYIESVWWLIKQIYKQKKLYKGYSIQPYSPKAGTGLSSHEINQLGMYKTIVDTTTIVLFKIKDLSKQKLFIKKKLEIKKIIDLYNIYFLVWTTTPWTLPSNTALAIEISIKYVLIKTFNQYDLSLIYVILAEKLINKQFNNKYFLSIVDNDFSEFNKNNKKIPYKIITTYLGKDLLNIRYEQLLPWVQPINNYNNAFQVIDAKFVNTDNGTGIVHIAPTFGSDDAYIAKKNNIPAILIYNKNKELVPLVNLQGKFLDINIIPKIFRNKFVKNEYYEKDSIPKKSIDEEMATFLKSQNKIFKIEKYSHSYPHCWRTNTPILYYPLNAWFIKVSDFKNKLVELNKTINWKPKVTGEKRFENWLNNANDWNLSRSRFWGTPLPIWRTKDGNEEKCIGSIQELVNEINKSISAGFLNKNPLNKFIIGNFSQENYNQIDLHNNFLDNIILVSNNGKAMYREPDVIDVWFDSGAVPYAQIHYPFSQKKEPLIADFIVEGVDQTRGWFYTLHVISTIVFHQIAYKNVVSNGLMLDKHGQKMSKNLGNIIDPFNILSIYGPDIIRWYLISNSNPWENLKFDVNKIEEIKKKFFDTLHNIYSFFIMYANVDQFTYSEKNIDFNKKPELDRWIISELNILIKKVDQEYENYEITRVCRLITNFVCNNLSNWYIRLNRKRFWKSEYNEDKISAYQTLYHCLETVLILSSPIIPFYSDELFQNLNKITKLRHNTISIHLTDFPKYHDNKIDNILIERIQLSQKISSLILSLRKKKNIKVRQPLDKVIIPVFNSNMKNHLESITNLIKQEVNVKNIFIVTDKELKKIIVKTAKPNFKILGPKFGNNVKFIGEKISQLTPNQISILETYGEIKIDNFNITITDIEILTKDIPGWLIASNENLTVALDITLNSSLMEEGIAREFINKIQYLRKKLNLNITDKINIEIASNIFNQSLLNFENYIKKETLTKNFYIKDKIDSNIEIEINKIKILIIINPIID